MNRSAVVLRHAIGVATTALMMLANASLLVAWHPVPAPLRAMIQHPSYADCTDPSKYQVDKAHQSQKAPIRGDNPHGQPLHLVLAAERHAHIGDEFALANGKLVGFLLNSSNNTLDSLAVGPGTAAAPSMTCVWIDKDRGAWRAVLYNNTAERIYPIQDPIPHKDPIGNPLNHPFPCAAWKPANDYSLCYPSGPQTMMLAKRSKLWDILDTKIVHSQSLILAEGFWLTCTSNGCCHINK